MSVVPVHNLSGPESFERPPEFHQPTECTHASCAAIACGNLELERLRRLEASLAASLSRERLLVEQKDELIRHKDLLSQESDHRLMNGLQLVTSLLSLQSRLTQGAEAAAQLKIAANRVATIGAIHRRLHALDHIESVELKAYLEALCQDISSMLHAEGDDNRLSVESIPLKVPSATGTALGFIVSELVTNSAKYAAGNITVRLGMSPGNGYALSVSDHGAGLPEGFDPMKSKGLGMKIVLSLVNQIGGELRFSPGDDNRGTRFTVMFGCQGGSPNDEVMAEGSPCPAVR